MYCQCTNIKAIDKMYCFDCQNYWQALFGNFGVNWGGSEKTFQKAVEESAENCLFSMPLLSNAIN